MLCNREKFELDLDRGKSGEEIVLEWLKANPNVKNIIDVREVQGCQEEDVDFIIFLQNDIIKLEVKTDFMAHNSGNIPFEIISNVEANTKGCLAKTKADFVCFYIYENKEMLFIPMVKLRRYIKQNESTLRYTVMGDNAEGYLLKIKDLIANKIAKSYKI